MKPGEGMRDAVKREVLEEVGLEIDVGNVVWVGEIITDDTHIVLIDFEAVVTGGRLSPGDDAEDAEWVPRHRLGHYRLTPTMLELMETIRP